MNDRSGVSYLRGSHDSANNPTLRDLKTSIKAQTTSLILESLGRMFDGIDDSFFELANHAHTNNEQNRFFESMREIRIKRKGIESYISKTMSEAFDKPQEIHQDNIQKSTDIPTDELSLVQNDALEEAVALDSMITKVKANYAGSLMHFQTRYSTFIGGENSQKLYNPLDPALLCHSFGRVCGNLDIEIKEKLIVFKQFDRQVMDNFVDALELGNKLLSEGGILPHLKYTAYKNKEQSPSGDNSDTDRPENDQRDYINHPSEDDVFVQAREILASLRIPSDPSNETEAPEGRTITDNQILKHFAQPPLHSTLSYTGPPLRIEAPELVDLLTNSRSASNTEDLSAGPVIPVDLRSSVQHLLDEKAKRAERPTEINQIDEDLINLVAMLFEFILDDYNLAAPIQVLISRLQIPILKVAIKDKGFFSKPSHPARKLLNFLAQASIGWSETSEKTKDKLYAKIHDIVREIINDEQCDLPLYEKLYTDFSKYIEREDRKSKLVEQRTKEAEIGRVKSQKARLVVDRILYDKISATAIPQVALDLVKSGWSRVMFLVYLKEGRGHRFSQCVKVVDELIWCLQPHADENSRKRWVQVVPKLLKNLKLGLREVSYNGGRLDELLFALKKELTQTFKQQSVSAALQDMPKLSDLKASIDAAESKDSITSDASLYEYLEQIDKLKSGDWVEFSLVNGNRFRCKFSTNISENNSLIFVNRMGLKVVEKSRMELAEELRKGQLILLQSGLLMDRAIDAVMQNLKKMSDKVA